LSGKSERGRRGTIGGRRSQTKQPGEVSLKIFTRMAAIGSLALGGLVHPALAKEPTIIVVSGPLFDPFFGPLKKGADDAAKALGVEYQYSTLQDANNVQADLARLVQQAAARHPDALVVSNFFPDAMGPQIKKASEAGIPVIIMDGGFSTWREVGGLTYVGYDPHSLGVKAGEAQATAGVKHGLCINHVPGNPALEQMCSGYADGLKAGGADAKNLTIPVQDAQNQQANLQAVKGALQADAAIDGIFTLGATQTDLSVRAAQETGREGKVKIGGVGLSTKVLEEVRDGKAQFGVDLQAYLDGFYAVTIAYQKAKFDMSPAEPVFAGPRLVFQKDAQRAIDINKEFSGYRGTE
jgi:simple sugar transport system substrate-binding protein